MTKGDLEVWKDIEGYEDTYQISNYGGVKSKGRVVFRVWKTGRKAGKSGDYTSTGRTLTPSKDKDGYFQISLWKNNKGTTFKVHRLVAQHFCIKPPDAYLVRHLDGDNQNNHHYNLCWGNHVENAKDTVSMGRSNFTPGEKHPNAKITDTQADEIRSLYIRGSNTNGASQLAVRYGANLWTIYSILNRKHRFKNP